MSTQENKALIHRIPEEMFNQGNLAVADELFAADYIEHAPILPGLPPGLPGLKQFVTALRSAFPDLRCTVEDEVAEGDKVVVRLSGHGTHGGELLGIPATNHSATWTEIHIARLEGGKLVEHWATIDQLGMLTQLGVIPAMGQPGPTPTAG